MARELIFNSASANQPVFQLEVIDRISSKVIQLIPDLNDEQVANIALLMLRDRRHDIHITFINEVKEYIDNLTKEE